MIAQPEKTCLDIKASLVQDGLFSDSSSDAGNTWRISPEPYFLSQEETTFFHELGPKLLQFYSVLNRFYLDSAKGNFHPWLAEYLDAGKPQELIDFGRMKRMRQVLPGIIRPDVIPTENGFAVTELDSVPGGFGLTSSLMSLIRRSCMGNGRCGHSFPFSPDGGIGLQGTYPKCSYCGF